MLSLCTGPVASSTAGKISGTYVFDDATLSPFIWLEFL